MKAMSKVTLTLGLMIIVSLFLTSCSGVVTPGINNGNTGNPSSNNPNSNNYQNPSTDPVEEQVTEETATNPSSNNPNSNNYQNPSTDPVEEQATEESATVEVDTTKPVITGSRDPLPNSFGWNNSNVTVSFSCADTGPVQSGIDINTVAGKTLTTEGKNQSVTNTGVCIDATGNTADPVTVSNINIDKTSPEVTITLPGTGEYILNQSITATWSAIDALSGVVSPASGTESIDTSSVGTKTFTLPAGTAMDKAGNSSLKVTKSYSVIADTEDPEMIYPQQWATGDGTAGNPWANDCIQSAYDACPTGGTIYLRAGYYQLADELQITKRINIIGEGMGKTFILTANETGLQIWNIDYVTLKEFTIDGDAQTSKTKNCIDAVGFGVLTEHYILMENLEAKNAINCGINLYQVSYVLVQNIYAHDNGEHGVHSGADAVNFNKYNVFRDIYAWDNGNGGFDDRGNAADKTAECYNVYDNINAWDNGDYGILFDDMSNCVLSNSFGSGNGKTYYGYGLFLYGVENFSIDNCSFTLNKEEGIYIRDSSNINFANVLVKNNNALDTEVSGIALKNSSGIRFTSCQSYDDRDTPLQVFGIDINNTNTDISLLNCELTPNSLGEIYDPTGVAVITEKMLAKF